jgi:nucleotide-binding universal stress UspA family protein
MNLIRTIVVPYDFSKYSEAALDAANGLAVQLGAEIHLLHVVQHSPYGYARGFDMRFGGVSTRALNAYRRELRRAAAGCPLRPDRIHAHVVEAFSVPIAINFEAERLGADLIVMGTHGRSGLTHVLMGSIAEATTRSASCPVMTVPCRAGGGQRATHREASMHPAAGSF